jgi:ABC-type sugar transport system permease subunit
MVHSLVYTFGSLAIVLSLGMGLALFLNQPIRFRVLFLTLVVAPWIVS